MTKTTLLKQMTEVDTQNKNQAKPIVGLSQFISLSAFFTLLLIIFTVIAYFFSQLLNFSSEEYDNDCPIQGQNISITSFSYNWRKVTQSDKVQSDTLYIPEVQLSFSDSSKGELVLYFENNQLETVGHGKSLDMASLKKTTKDAPFIIHSSAGYKEKATYNSYRYSEAPYWSLVIKEIIPGKPDQIITKLSLPPKL